MRTRIKRAAAAATAVLALGLAPGVAAADQITAAPAGGISMTSAGSVTFIGAATVTCRLTLSGSFNRQIEDAAGGALSSLTRGTAGGCTAGTSAALLFASSWQVVLNGDAGLEETPSSLPVEVRGAAVSVTVAGIPCLYGGNLAASIALSGSPEVTGAVTVSGSLAKVSGSGACSATIRVAGTLAMEPAQTLLVPCDDDDIAMLPIEVVIREGETQAPVLIQNISPEHEAFFLLAVEPEGKFDFSPEAGCTAGIPPGGRTCAGTILLKEGVGRPTEATLTTQWTCGGAVASDSVLVRARP